MARVEMAQGGRTLVVDDDSAELNEVSRIAGRLWSKLEPVPGSPRLQAGGFGFNLDRSIDPPPEFFTEA